MEDYYTKNAKAYEEETRNADRSSVYSFLRPYLPKGKLSVLDVGFGSGRDRLYFKSLGYDVEGIDTSLPFVIDAKKKGLTCYQADRMEFVPSHSYDLIYALASLHHLKKEDIYPTIKKFLSYLKKDGVLFLSRKCTPKKDGYDKRGRYFTYLTDQDIQEFPFKIKARKKTVTPRRKDDIFLNRILRKSEN